MAKVLFRKAYPLFGDMAPKTAELGMNFLLELLGGRFFAKLGCDFVGPDTLSAVSRHIVSYFQATCPMLARAVPWPPVLQLASAWEIDLLWLADDPVFVYTDEHGQVFVDGIHYADRASALQDAVRRVPDDLWAASADVTDAYPQVYDAVCEDLWRANEPLSGPPPART